MTTNEIKQKLASTEYDFLRINEHLGNNIILLTTGGSHAYGTEVETSDLDIRGVTLETKREVLGLSQFEQFDNTATDTVVYGLRKYVGLILNCNPNTIEMLGTKEEQLFVLTEAGKLLRNNIDLFLSKKAIGSFGGYATQQLRRLENSLVRDSYPQAEKEKHILGTLKGQMNHFKEKYHDFTGQDMNIYLDKSEKEGYDQEVFMDLTLKHYPLRDFQGIYSEMHNVLGEYGKLTHRNRKKDDLHLNKHAMHLIRLLIMGIELLEGKGVNTFRGKDRAFLLKIRNGEFISKKSDGTQDYTAIFDMVNEYEAKFKYAAENTNLPQKPDYKKVEELLITIYEKELGG